ncbi:restriction endonuclease subunit S [Arthrobacter sp. H-02-3]|uniref:restriction endonuclease subunit S n=1 Tax=Arthrobacter sp. H-02-3 TaxID=2703675 RepID=UPI00137A526B|nr:restriction endonuclease subunit S [Arthrobacter sp. H-02-3]
MTKGKSPTLKTVPGDYPLIVTGPEPLSSVDYQFDGEAVCIPMVSSTGHGHASLKRVHYANGKFAVANIVTACEVKNPAKSSTRFLHIYLQHYKDELIVPRMQGTANVSLSQRELSQVPVRLPALDEQLRIVNLIGAVDQAVEASETRFTASNQLLNEYLEGADFSQRRPLGELASMRSGPSWKAANESSVPAPGGESVLGITNTPPGRELDLSNRKYVSGLPKSTKRVTPTSIVMIRTNGNRARIGNVYRPSPEIEGFAVSAFQIIIQPTDPADSAIIYWALSRPSIQRMMSESASGSTGLGNIAIGWLRQLSLPYPTGEEREIFLGTCEAMLDAIKAADETSRSLRTVRSELLSALLSGAHRIPETYDELMGA